MQGNQEKPAQRLDVSAFSSTTTLDNTAEPARPFAVSALTSCAVVMMGVNAMMLITDRLQQGARHAPRLNSLHQARSLKSGCHAESECS